MSFLRVIPDAMTSAAANLDAIGSELNAAHAAAASGTTGMAAMATDEVSAAVRSTFVTYAQRYQAVSAQAADFHAAVVRLFNSNELAYLGTEVASARKILGSAEQTIEADAAAAGQIANTDAATVGVAVRAAETDVAADEQYVLTAAKRVALPVYELHGTPLSRGPFAL